MITLHRRAALLSWLLPLAARAAPAPVPVPVVASFSILADLARQVGGDDVRVVSLVPPDGDPHQYQPRPSDLQALRSAAAMIENGLGLEGGLSRLVESSGFPGVRVIASAGIVPRQAQEGGHSIPDPHIWQDPRLAQRMVATIASGLARADPPRAAAYASRAQAYAAAIGEADNAIAQRFAAIPEARRQIITTHDAFAYYGARYGIRFLAAEGISTEAEPSPRALARLAAQIRKAGIRTVFLENMSDPRLAEALAREAGAVTGAKLYADSLSPADGPAPTYLDLLRYNTAQFLAALQS